MPLNLRLASRSALIGVVVAVLVSACATRDTGPETEWGPDLLAGVAPVPAKSGDPAVVRDTRARIRTELLASGADGRPVHPRLRFAPFPNVTLRLTFERYEAASCGIVWVGRVEGAPAAAGPATFASCRGEVAGHVQFRDAEWTVRPGDAGWHLIEQVDASKLPPPRE